MSLVPSPIPTLRSTSNVLCPIPWLTLAIHPPQSTPHPPLQRHIFRVLDVLHPPSPFKVYTVSSLRQTCCLIQSLVPRVTSDAGTLPVDYPEGTVLLSTRMRYGEISYEGEDVEDWDHRWQPSEKTVHDLRRDWKSVAVAKVMFITNASGGVLCRAQRCKDGFYAWFIATFYFMWEFVLSPQATIVSICRVIKEKSRGDGLCAKLIAFSLFLLGCTRDIIVFVIAIYLGIWGLLRLCYEWLNAKSDHVPQGKPNVDTK